MKTLWVFNPENDIALGNNLRHFTPPRNAMLLRRHGALLPLWMADDGDFIFADDATETSRDFIKYHNALTGKNVSLLSHDNIGCVERVRPWGWSNAIATELARAGVSPDLMPDAQQIEDIRRISHRHSSIIINTALAGRGIDAVFPAEVTSTGALEALLQQGKPLVIKSPWSSSGRGVMYSNSMSQERLLQLCDGIIRHQGSVLAEPMLSKLLDFAMLFDVKAGKVEYVGLSVFDTDSGGNYSGNIVAPEQYLAAKLTEYASYAELKKIREALPEILTNLIGNAYEGVCGVDMMVYRDDAGTNRIAPCIELNLRYTMGYVAHCLDRQLLHDTATAFFNITYKGKRDDSTSPTTPPEKDANRHLVAGTLPLVPVNDYFDISLAMGLR